MLDGPSPAGSASDDDQRLRLGAGGGEVAQVDRRRLVAEVAPGRPLEAEVDSLDERVLRDDDAAVEDGRVVPDRLGEPAPGELREEPELTEIRESARPKTSTGPLPDAELGEAVPDGLARRSAAAPRAASSRLSPRASSAASAAECVQPAPCVALSG